MKCPQASVSQTRDAERLRRYQLPNTYIHSLIDKRAHAKHEHHPRHISHRSLTGWNVGGRWRTAELSPFSRQ